MVTPVEPETTDNGAGTATITEGKQKKKGQNILRKYKRNLQLFWQIVHKSTQLSHI